MISSGCVKERVRFSCRMHHKLFATGSLCVWRAFDAVVGRVLFAPTERVPFAHKDVCSIGALTRWVCRSMRVGRNGFVHRKMIQTICSEESNSM